MFDLRTSRHLEKLSVLGVGTQPVCRVPAPLGLLLSPVEAASAVTPLQRRKSGFREESDSPRVTQLGASRAGVLGVPAKASQAPGAILRRVGGMGPSEDSGSSCLPGGLASAPDTCTHHRPVGRVLARSAGPLAGWCCRVRQGMSVGGVAGGEDRGACACHPLGPLCPHP